MLHQCITVYLHEIGMMLMGESRAAVLGYIKTYNHPILGDMQCMYYSLARIRFDFNVPSFEFI